MKLFKQFKKVVSSILLLVTLMASFNMNGFIMSAATDVSGNEFVTLIRTSEERPGPTFQGDEAGATQHRFTYPIASVKDSAGTVGYCIEPFARGVSPNGQEQTLSTVPNDQLDDRDKQLLGIMMAGYPTVTHGWSDEDEYMATQIAIQHFLFQNTDKYPNSQSVVFDSDNWSHWGSEPIVELAKSIYDQGLLTPYVPGANPNTPVKLTPENSGKFENNGETLEIGISIEASDSFEKAKLTLPDEIKNLVKSGKGAISIDGRAASFKTYILGSDDSYEGIEIQPGDTVVRIVMDKLSAEAYVPVSGETKSVEFTFEVVGVNIMQAFKGKNLDDSNQDYIFTAPGKAEPVTGTLSWTRETKPDEQTPPGNGGLKILKYNKKANQLISGAIFEIRGVSETNWDFLVQIQASPGAAIPLPDGGTAKTGVGTIELTDIRPGQYQITEITPPPNFDYCALGVNSQVVTVLDTGDSGLFPQVRFENNPFAGLRIKKIDAVTGEPVNGVVMRIQNELADIDVEMVTMNGGAIDMKNLPQGNYEISEVFAPNNYVLSNETKVTTLRWGETTEITFENQPTTELRVKKVDAETGEALDGAVFKLTKPDTGDTWEDTTYYDGYAIFSDIPAGTYVLEEVKAPRGYLLDATKRTIVVENYKTNEVVVQNSRKPALIIKKYDEGTAKPLPGAEFRVAKMSGQIIFEGITDENGEIRLEDLTEEWYKITEIAAPPGYLIAAETKDVLFEANKVLEVKFDNRRRPALEILKLDEKTKKPLAGAVFHVRKAEDDTVSEYVTDESGKITLIDLDEAVYSIVEVKAPDGYILESQHKNIQTEWGKMKQLIFTNKEKPKLRILKVDAVTGKPLQNAEFRVSKAEGETIFEYITDETGEILIENLDEAVYKIEEFMAPDGYIRYDESKEIALEWGQTKIIKFDNIRKPTLIITKLNGLTNQPVPGATYKIEYGGDNGGLVPVGSYVTDENGQIIIPKVNAGWYVATETKPAPGFSPPSNPVTRIYLEPGENAYISDENDAGNEPVSDGDDYKILSGNDFTPTQNAQGEPIYNWPLNSIVIKKTDAVTGELLEGAVFELYRADSQVSGVPGTNIGRFTTDNSGIIVITGLEAGYYVVKEAQPPENYMLSENSMQNGFLKADGTTVLEFAFANHPFGAILITKVDAITGKPLANARFKVTDSTGAVVGNTNGEYISDENGEILIANVKPGAYIVTEIEAPPHYAVDTTPQTIDVGTDGKTYKVSFKDMPAGGIIIRKLDAVTKEPLADTEFKITTSDGSVVGTSNGIFKTDETGTIILPNLPKGSYIIEETKAPAGYILENQAKTIAVDYGKTYTVDFYNKKMSGLQIIKIDAETKQPLKGAEFTIYKKNGVNIILLGNQ